MSKLLFDYNMSRCIVRSCRNRTWQKGPAQLLIEESKTITFHQLPKDANAKMQWLEALKLSIDVVSKGSAVCSMHFHENDYKPGLKLRILKKNAVPQLTEEKGSRNHVSTANELKQGKKYRNDTYPTKIMGSSTIFAINTGAQESSAMNEVYQIYSTPVEKIETVNKNINNKVEMVDRSTSVSPHHLMNSPMKVQMRDLFQKELQAVKKQLWYSKKQCKRSEERVQKLKNTLKELQKNLVSNEDHFILTHLDEEIGK